MPVEQERVEDAIETFKYDKRYGPPQGFLSFLHLISLLYKYKREEDAQDPVVPKLIRYYIDESDLGINPNYSDKITVIFVWSPSLEGHSYWSDLHDWLLNNSEEYFSLCMPNRAEEEEEEEEVEEEEVNMGNVRWEEEEVEEEEEVDIRTRELPEWFAS